MHGNFEVENSAWPVGYLKAGLGGNYFVTDMRGLAALHSEPIPLDEAVRIAKVVNAELREGPRDERYDVAVRVKELIHIGDR